MAKPVNVTIAHDLGREAAHQRIEGGIDKLLNSMAGGMLTFDRQWAGDTMSFGARAMGQHVTGKVEVREAEVEIEVRLPIFLAGMAETIAGKIRGESKLLLEKK